MTDNSPNRVGWQSLLGEQGSTTVTCRITTTLDEPRFDNQVVAVNELTIRSGEAGNSYSIQHLAGGGFFASTSQQQIEDYISANEGLTFCPNTFFPAQTGDQTWSVQGETISTEHGDSGIYEFVTVVVIAVSIMLLMSLVYKGIGVTKTSVNAFTEETDNASNIEYYEGPNGQEYFRIKRKSRSSQ